MSNNTEIQQYNSPEALRQAWKELLAADPHLYARNAAQKLGVSEARLIALGGSEGKSHRLYIPDYAAFLRTLPEFNPVLALVRNDNAVLERDCSPVFTPSAHHGFVSTGDGVLLAFNPNAVANAFVVRAEKFLKRGLQFFDSAGVAILKLYLRDEAKLAAFDAWLQPWLAADQSDDLPAPVPSAEAAKASEGGCGHHHHHGEGETAHAAAHAAHGGAHTCQCGGSAVRYATEAPIALPAKSYETLLTAAIKSGEAVTVGVANGNAFLSVTAPVKKTVPSGPWFNILDAELHLHLASEAAKSASAFIGADANGAGTLKVSFQDEAGRPFIWFRVAGDSYAAAQTLAETIVK
jgi:putative hemin transport protein